MEEQREGPNLLLYLIFGVKGTVFYVELYCSLFLINSSDWEFITLTMACYGWLRARLRL